MTRAARAPCHRGPSPAWPPILAAALVACGCGVGLILGALALARSPPALDAAAVARGAVQFAGLCTGCHGAPDGPAPPLDASGHAWQHSDAQLARIIAVGAVPSDQERVVMPGFAGQLGPAEIADLLAYLKSRWPVELRQHQALRNAGGEAALRALLADPTRTLPGDCLPASP